MARRKRRSFSFGVPPSTQTTETTYFSKYESWGDFLAVAEDTTLEESKRGSGGGGSHDVSFGFQGVYKFEEAVDLARYGWAEGEAAANEIAAPLFDKVASMIDKQIYSYGVEGMDFDIARVIEGEPECWMRQENITVEAAGRHVRIVFNCTVSGGIRKEVITAKGAAMAALIQCLELGGVRVQLECLPVCVHKNAKAGSYYESRIILKQADQNLDVSRLMFALAHPAMLRCLGFAEAENPRKNPNQREEIGYGFGSCADTRDKGDLYIGQSYYGEPQWNNTDAARAWVIAQLKEQGVKLHEAK